jgi:uncharacterized RDD family membrane protein YckC
MDGERFTVQGMTGVDLSLRVAGTGSRAYAFIIDWHIRVLLALAWLITAMLAVNGALRVRSGNGPWMAALIMGPPAAIYFLYHPVVELLMHGQTPGKRMAGVRIVTRDGGPPGAGAVLIRNAFRLIDSLPLLYVIGLICTFVSAQHLRIGDMAAGTLLIMNEPDAGKGIEKLGNRGTAAGLDPNTLDLIDQLLERWQEMDANNRGAIARKLLQRIDANPQTPPDGMSDEQLRNRLLLLSGGGVSR